VLMERQDPNAGLHILRNLSESLENLPWLVLTPSCSVCSTIPTSARHHIFDWGL
jgi:hypothetical protein